ncbi:unnamed protein product [Symbiodinium sp. CCMP2592]|nr:unnamed protein product [Symbiodinium sp. CCMP2592]
MPGEAEVLCSLSCSQSGSCLLDSFLEDRRCPYAHNEEELRSTGLFYKKSLCIWHQKGKCRNGEMCRFAHGSAEQRMHNHLRGKKSASSAEGAWAVGLTSHTRSSSSSSSQVPCQSRSTAPSTGSNYDQLGKASDGTVLQSYAAQLLAAHDWPQAAPAQQPPHQRQVVLQASPLAGALEVQQQQQQQQQQLQLKLLQLQQLKALVESHLPSAGLQMPQMTQASLQEANLQADMASLTRSVTSLSEQLSRIEDQMHPLGRLVCGSQ